MMQAGDEWLDWVASVCGSSRARRGERIQALWSGYGEIVRVYLTGGTQRSVVVKRVQPPADGSHPRGWSGARSHERKLRSYRVEQAFYTTFASSTVHSCRVPASLGALESESEWLFVLEDLDASGFVRRPDHLTARAMDTALRWLASFHATMLGCEPTGLWEQGTYWHLSTRPDEWAATTDARLKASASRLDARLRSARFQTLVHGDAKLANLCFTADESGVAGVDFQYAGRGIGVVDLAYFLGSCLTEQELTEDADRHVDAYFAHLRTACAGVGADPEPVEREWRALYAVAWADFARFLSGWAPGHWKLHGYTERMVERALR